MMVMQLQLQSGGKWQGSCCCLCSLNSIKTLNNFAKTTKIISPLSSPSLSLSSNSIRRCSALGMLAAAVVLSTPPPSEETLSNIPQTLSGESTCESNSGECQKSKGRIQRPKSRKAESCTSKCVGTCTRGDDEGPLNVRRPIVVFKQGFRSRQYCLVECSDICNLLDDADKRR